MSTPVAPDRVFAAFCGAGLWPGLGKRAAAELTSPQVVEAAGGIEQHALDVCKVDLSTGGLDF